jgi:hypothetical protein
MSRAGRKRKSGTRHPGGQLKREHQPDDRVRTSRQPHRRALAHEMRAAGCDYIELKKASAGEEAESPIGRLWLSGRLAAKQDRDAAAARDRYDAGNMFAQVVGAYLSVIEAPGGTSGSGQKSACQADLLCALDTSECACFGRRRRYTNAYEALAGGARIDLEAGLEDLPAPLRTAIAEARRLRHDETYIPIAADRRRIVKAVTSVAVHQAPIAPEELVYLVRGLEILRQHFGLTERRKSKQYRNAK